MSTIHMSQDLYDVLHPIGEYIENDGTVNPNNQAASLGVTAVWEQTAKGRCLMGAGEVEANTDNWCGTTNAGDWTAYAGNMGGSTINTHNHYSGSGADDSGAVYIENYTYTPRTKVITGDQLFVSPSVFGDNKIARINSTEDETIYIMSPYLVAYIWHRVS